MDIYYDLHQTVIVIIGYYVVQWGVDVLVKYAVIIAGSFAASVLVYDVAVRRTNVTRFLFGMKPQPWEDQRRSYRLGT